MNVEDAEARIRLSAQRLREWQWMSGLSSAPEEALVQLRQEARELIALGMENPAKAKTIGKLVVAYHRLMVALNDRTG